MIYRVLQNVTNFYAEALSYFRKISRISDFTEVINIDRRPKIYVDISNFYKHDAKTGIQRVVRSIILNLNNQSVDGFDVHCVYATRKKPYQLIADDFTIGASRPNVFAPTIGNNRKIDLREGDIFLALDLAANILPRWKKQIQSWKANGAKIYVVVYDLLPVINPTWFPDSTVKNFNRWIDFVYECFEDVICISEEVRKDFYKLLSKSKYKTRSIRSYQLRLGGELVDLATPTGSAMSSDARYTPLMVGPTVLMVGTVEPRKGYDKALAAFQKFWIDNPTSEVKLAIVGKPGWKTHEIQYALLASQEIDKRLFWLPSVTDDALRNLYKHCVGVFVCSFAEGFGLPIAEAATYRKRLLVRNIPVFRESGNPNISFFDNDEPAALADTLKNWLESITNNNQYISFEGVSWCTTFTDLCTAMNVVALDEPSY